MAEGLTRGFFDRPVLEVAPDLLGCVVSAGAVAVRLTEVEAYDGGNDEGSHAYRGPTGRNRMMFGPPGHLYVYFSYGMHWCANVVCGPADTASAVLLRAGEVVRGVDMARERRGSRVAFRDLARGPARLCSALGIDRSANGADLLTAGGAISLLPGEPPRSVSRGPRVGLRGAAGHPWRFWASDEPTVSAYRPHVPRRRG